MGTRLTFLYKTKTNKHSCWMAMYLCSCGVKKEILMSSVRTNTTKSCGCLQRERATNTGKKNIKYAIASKGSQTHGMSNYPEFKVWMGMKARCSNPEDKHYCGRGVRVCSSWLNSFDRFILEMGRRPTDKHSIDRIDNDKGYSKDNCRWATIIEQANNKRTSKTITYNNKTQTIAEWARETGLNKKMLYARASRGWTPNHIFTPSQPNGTNQHTTIEKRQ